MKYLSLLFALVASLNVYNALSQKPGEYVSSLVYGDILGNTSTSDEKLNGRVKESTAFSNTISSGSKTVMTFNENGGLLEYKYFLGSDVQDKRTLSYDNNGLLVRVESTARHENTYISYNGNKMISNIVEDKGKKIKKIEFFYNQEGQWDSILVMKSEAPIYKIKFAYDAKGNKVEMANYKFRVKKNAWEISDKLKFEYDADNNLVAAEKIAYTFMVPQGAVDSKVVFDKNKNVVGEFVYGGFEDGKLLVARNVSATYDEHNNIKETKTVDNGELVAHFTYAYTYDVQGNKTSSVITDVLNKQSFTEKFEYVYY